VHVVHSVVCPSHRLCQCKSWYWWGRVCQTATPSMIDFPPPWRQRRRRLGWGECLHTPQPQTHCACGNSTQLASSRAQPNQAPPHKTPTIDHFEEHAASFQKLRRLIRTASGPRASHGWRTARPPTMYVMITPHQTFGPARVKKKVTSTHTQADALLVRPMPCSPDPTWTPS